MKKYLLLLTASLTSCGSMFHQSADSLTDFAFLPLTDVRSGKWAATSYEPAEGCNYRPGGADFAVNIHASHLFRALCNYDMVMKTGINWDIVDSPTSPSEIKRMPEMTRENARKIVLSIIAENKDDCINDIYREWELSTTPLFAALRAGDSVLVEALINKGARTEPLYVCNVEGEEPIVWAEVVKSKDADVQAAYQLYLKLREK